MESGDKLIFLGHKRSQTDYDDKLYVALDVWTERELKAESVHYISAEAFIPSGKALKELSILADTIAREWYRIPSAKQLVYKELNIGQVYEPMLGFYLGKFLYFLHTIDGIIGSRVNVASVSLEENPSVTSESAGVFTQFEEAALRDALKVVCAKYSIPFTTRQSVVQKLELFPKNKGRFILSLFNTCISMFSSKQPRLYVSDYWSHISSFALNMTDGEFVFMDRKEIKNIPIKQILKHRVKFMHPLDLITFKDIHTGEQDSKRITSEWSVVRNELLHSPWFTTYGMNWFDVFDQALSYALTHHSTRLVAEYESFTRIFKKEKIQKVILRASIGGRQHHFFLITRVAYELGIPTIELQHANEIVDGSSVHSMIAADYLASYGDGTRDVMVGNHGYDPDRIRSIGSPRFDSYRTSYSHETIQKKKILESIGLDSRRPVLFFGIPPEIPDLYFIHFDSFGITHSLTILGEVQKQNEGLQIILKFRPGSVTSDYRSLIQSIFPRDTVIAEYENPFELISASDVVVTGNSTIFYEGMQAKVPTILFPLKDNDLAMRSVYGETVPAPISPDDLGQLIKNLLTNTYFRDQIIQKQITFLKNKCSFDGKAGLRLLSLVHENLKPKRSQSNSLSSWLV